MVDEVAGGHLSIRDGILRIIEREAPETAADKRVRLRADLELLQREDPGWFDKPEEQRDKDLEEFEQDRQQRRLRQPSRHRVVLYYNQRQKDELVRNELREAPLERLHNSRLNFDGKRGEATARLGQAIDNGMVTVFRDENGQMTPVPAAVATVNGGPEIIRSGHIIFGAGEKDCGPAWLAERDIEDLLKLCGGTENANAPSVEDQSPPDRAKTAATNETARIEPQPPAIPNGPEALAGPPQVSRRRAPSGVNYTTTDAPLVDEMGKLIRSGEARGPWDAALAVSARAAGKGDATSRTKRLVKAFSRVQS